MTGPSTPPELPPGLLEEYLAGMRTELGVLSAIAERLARAGNDREALEALRRETHKIHGSAGSYGFMDASRLAAGMEATVKDWVARPEDPEVSRGSLAHWFVSRVAELHGLPIPHAPAAAPPLRVGPPPRPGQAPPAKPARPQPVSAPPKPPVPAPARPPARPTPPLPPSPAPAIPRAPTSAPARPSREAPPAAPAPAAKPPAPARPQPRAPSPTPATPAAAPPGTGDLPWVVPPGATPPPAAPPPVAPPKPAPQPKPSVQPTRVAAARPPAPTPSGPALTVPEVIVVEDDAALAELLEYGLRSRGYRFTSYRNGREALTDLLALDTAGTHPLLLLDVDLPALDGYSIFDALQRERPGVYRVVFTTVHGDESEQLRGLEAGALDYLVKPLSLRVALEKVRRWVGR